LRTLQELSRTASQLVRAATPVISAYDGKSKGRILGLEKRRTTHNVQPTTFFI